MLNNSVGQASASAITLVLVCVTCNDEEEKLLVLSLSDVAREPFRRYHQQGSGPFGAQQHKASITPRSIVTQPAGSNTWYSKQSNTPLH
jgi:hypothetical protein